MNLQKSALTLAVGLALSHTAYASPIVSGFASGSIPIGLNQSSEEVPIGFEINFFGERWENTYVNENGNITFAQSFGSFRFSDLEATGNTIIAPFFADVYDSEVTYGQGQFQYQPDEAEYNAFGVNWLDVNYNEGPEDAKKNSFQLILVDRQDDGTEGDFDIIFNYDDIFWDDADSSPYFPSVGFSNPPPYGTVSNTRSTDTTFFELPGSGQPGAFLNDGPDEYALASNSYNSDIEGRYIFEFRGNSDIFEVPEPATLLLLGSGLLGLAFARRRILNG